MSSVLVTVQGPEQRVELQLPADRPVAELLPLLVEVCARRHQSEHVHWELGPLGGLAFDGGKTLAEVGVVDGALLHLRDSGASGVEPEDVPPEAAQTWPPPPAWAGDEPQWKGGWLVGEQWRREHWPTPPQEAGLLPQDRTRMILPARHGFPERLAAAMTAALNPGRSAPAPAVAEPGPGQIVDPSSLMLKAGPGMLDRIRESWRSTDYVNRLDVTIVAPQLRRCATIAVMSPKGGVGKTTVTTLLGTLLGMLRPDRIVAIDTNPDFGSLGRQLAPQHTVFVDDLYEVLDEPELTATALDNHLGRAAHGLMVLPAPTDQMRAARLDAAAYTKVVRKLQQMVGIIVLDAGAGLHEPAARAALATADQVVLVSDSEPSTASLVAEAAAVLKGDGLPLWLVMNKMGISSELDVRAFGAVIPHARGLIELRHDLPAARSVASGRFQWMDASESWKRSVRELAASLVADWRELGIAA